MNQPQLNMTKIDRSERLRPRLTIILIYNGVNYQQDVEFFTTLDGWQYHFTEDTFSIVGTNPKQPAPLVFDEVKQWLHWQAIKFREDEL